MNAKLPTTSRAVASELPPVQPVPGQLELIPTLAVTPTGEDVLTGVLFTIADLDTLTA